MASLGWIGGIPGAVLKYPEFRKQKVGKNGFDAKIPCQNPLSDLTLTLDDLTCLCITQNPLISIGKKKRWLI